jgi:hypothetical protein
MGICLQKIVEDAEKEIEAKQIEADQRGFVGIPEEKEKDQKKDTRRKQIDTQERKTIADGDEPEILDETMEDKKHWEQSEEQRHVGESIESIHGCGFFWRR